MNELDTSTALDKLDQCTVIVVHRYFQVTGVLTRVSATEYHVQGDCGQVVFRCDGVQSINEQYINLKYNFNWR